MFVKNLKLFNSCETQDKSIDFHLSESSQLNISHINQST
jgi:hypothetical protein